MNISQDNLNSPNNGQKKGSESNCTNVKPESPTERSAEWTIQLSSVWSEIPNASNTCQHELTNIVNESNVPQQSEQIEIPQITPRVRF